MIGDTIWVLCCDDRDDRGKIVSTRIYAAFDNVEKAWQSVPHMVLPDRTYWVYEMKVQ